MLAQIIEQMSKDAAELRAELAALRKEAAVRDAALRAKLSLLIADRVLSPSAPSYATVGTEALAALTASGRIAVADLSPASAPDAERAPFATAADLTKLSECKSERELVLAITPLLLAARGFDVAAGATTDPCARVLVNSERTPWLDALHAPLPSDQLKRPDLFATWAPFWSGRVRPTGGLVGRLAHRELQLDGCVREFYEAKLGSGDLTSADFGQLVDYHSRVDGSVRGVLFNARVFWLYESVRNLPVALTKAEWGAHGSRALLRAFFDRGLEPPLVPLLRHLCSTLQLAPVCVAASAASPAAGDDGTTRRSGAFLGAGGSARVFSVTSNDSTAALRALKVSTKLSRADLEYEFATLQRAAAAGAPVIPVVADSLVCSVDDNGAHCGGGFLMSEVCAGALLDSGTRCAAAFTSLHKLHAAGFVHGDARLPNLLMRGGRGADLSFVWIDLRDAAAGALAVAQRADARTFAASVLRVEQRGGGTLPAPVDLAIGRVPTDGEAAYSALGAAVWAARAAGAMA